MPEEMAVEPPSTTEVKPVLAPVEKGEISATLTTMDVSSMLCVEAVEADVDADDDEGDDPDEEESEERPKNSKLNVCKKAWTAAEDKILQEIVEKNGAHRWSTVAGNLPGRMGKQCRER